MDTFLRMINLQITISPINLIRYMKEYKVSHSFLSSIYLQGRKMVLAVASRYKNKNRYSSKPFVAQMAISTYQPWATSFLMVHLFIAF